MFEQAAGRVLSENKEKTMEPPLRWPGVTAPVLS